MFQHAIPGSKLRFEARCVGVDFSHMPSDADVRPLSGYRFHERHDDGYRFNDHADVTPETAFARTFVFDAIWACRFNLFQPIGEHHGDLAEAFRRKF